MKTLEAMFDELGQMPAKALRQIASADYGLEMGELVRMDKLEILDAMMSIEQNNAFK